MAPTSFAQLHAQEADLGVEWVDSVREFTGTDCTSTQLSITSQNEICKTCSQVSYESDHVLKSSCSFDFVVNARRCKQERLLIILVCSHILITFIVIYQWLKPFCGEAERNYSYTQIKRADQQLAWRRRRSNFRGKLTYIHLRCRIRSFGVFRHLDCEYHSEFISPQTRHSVTQCTWALVHAADFRLTTLVNCIQLIRPLLSG